MRFMRYWMYGYDKASLRAIAEQTDGVVDYLSNSRSQLVINKAMDFPVIRQLLTYHPTNYPRVGAVLAAIFPVSIPFYIIGVRHQANLKADVALVAKVCDELQALLADDNAAVESDMASETNKEKQVGYE